MIVLALSGSAADLGVRISDGAIKAVAQNNSLLIQAGDNPYLAERLAKSISIPAGNARLFDFQANHLLF